MIICFVLHALPNIQRTDLRTMLATDAHTATYNAAVASANPTAIVVTIVLSSLSFLILLILLITLRRTLRGGGPCVYCQTPSVCSTALSPEPNNLSQNGCGWSYDRMIIYAYDHII